MRQFAIVASLLFLTISAQGQSAKELKVFFEGKQVVLRIDMPGTASGVNLYPERSQALDYREYSKRLKTHGTALEAGSPGRINQLKVKSNHLEMQLGSVANPKMVRFNIHFDRIDEWMLTPATIVDALQRYVQFADSDLNAVKLTSPSTSSYATGYVRHRVVQLGPRTTYLQVGMRQNEAVRLLGEPVSITRTNRDEGLVSVYEFRRSMGRTLIAEFSSGKLIRYRTESV
ncbi:MAG TPA: hypothetical protein VLB68_31605 [Pyrinomonadaceae bacterium]|nr:hypothetical protein [Pyrinomonadaceae bacterium]